MANTSNAHRRTDVEVATALGLPELAYTFVEGALPGARIGIIKRGEAGYHLTDFDRPDISEDLVRKVIADRNGRLGVTPAQAEAMTIGSMFGWRCPGADPARYDGAGKLIRRDAQS